MNKAKNILRWCSLPFILISGAIIRSFCAFCYDACYPTKISLLANNYTFGGHYIAVINYIVVVYTVSTLLVVHWMMKVAPKFKHSVGYIMIGLCIVSGVFAIVGAVKHNATTEAYIITILGIVCETVGAIIAVKMAEDLE